VGKTPSATLRQAWCITPTTYSSTKCGNDPTCQKRDRSPITVAALTALGKLDQLQFHLGFARQNGVTDDELKEALLHLAFYSGWPNGMGATTVLKNIIENEK
jgi:4-carboxymuconolactone decarboxylase